MTSDPQRSSRRLFANSASVPPSRPTARTHVRILAAIVIFGVAAGGSTLRAFAASAVPIAPAKAMSSTQGGQGVCRRISGVVRVASLSGIHLVLDSGPPAENALPERSLLVSPYDGTLNVGPVPTTTIHLKSGRDLPESGEHIAIDGYNDGSYFVAERIGEYGSPPDPIHTAVCNATPG